MAESYSVKAVLSATDKGFSSGIKGASSALDSLGSKIKSGIGFGVLTGIGQKAFDAISSGISGIISDMNESSAAWKTFQGNMSMNGHGAKEIKKTQSALQDFATKTIYSASDMATTFAQLDAVGIKGTQELVTGFGGLAAAAENPQQAMKTLSQQATQMAAKPKVQWQDFKLMLEQTPAGIAAIAKEMGMTTAELVKQVQAGTVKTEDFFNAIKKVGNNEDFSKLATQYKTVSQAMDGLKETLSNKLAPAFNAVSDVGIKTVSAITDALAGIDGDKLGKSISAFAKSAGRYWAQVKVVAPSVEKAFCDAFSVIRNALGKLNGDFGSDQSVVNFGKSIIRIAEPLKSLAGFLEDHAGTIAQLLEKLPQLAGAYAGLQAVGKVAPGLSAFASASDLFGSKISVGTKKMGRSVSSTLSGVSGKLKGASFDGFTKKGLKSFTKVGKQFRGLGKSFDGYGMKIAEVMHAVSPKLDGAGVKIWDTLSKTGEKVGKSGSKMSQNLRKSFKGVTEAISPVQKRFATIAEPFRAAIGKVGSASTAVGGKMASGLTSMMGLAMKLLAPAALVGAALAGLGLLYQQFGGQIDAMLQLAAQKGPQIITNLANGVTEKLPALIEQGAQLVSGLMNAITANIPAIIQAGVSIIQSLVQGVGNSLPTLIPAAISMISALADGILGALPQLVVMGMNLLLALAQGIVTNAPLLIQSAVSAITTFVDGASQALPSILNTAVQIIQTLIAGLVQNLPSILSAGIAIIQSLITGVVNNLPAIISSGFEIIGSLITGIVQMLPSILSAGWDIITTLGQGLLEAIPKVIAGIVDGIAGLFSDLWSFITGGAGDAASSIEEETQAMSASLSNNTSSATASVGSSAQSMASDVNSSCNSIDFSGASGKFGSLSNSVGSATGTVITDSRAMASGASSACNNIDTSGAVTQYNDLSGTVNSAMKSIGNTNTSGLKDMQASYDTTFKSVGNIVSAGMSKVSSAIRSGGAKATSYAKIAASSIVSAFQSAVPKATSAGTYIGRGLANGMSSQLSRVRSVAAQLAAAADAAIRAKAKIASPSKVTKKSGGYMGKGLAVGLLSKVNDVTAAAKKLAAAAMKQLQTGTTANNGKYKALGESLNKAYKTDLTNSLNKTLKAAKKLIAKKTGKKLTSKIYAAFSSALKSGTNKAITATQKAITKISEKAQEKYDEVIQKRTAFFEKLSDVGSLYTVDSYGYMTLKNFDAGTAQIKALSKNMEKLKKVLPEGLMDEIAGMDTADGIAYTNKLLKMSGAELKAYGASYTKYVKSAKTASNTFYQSRLNTINQGFDKAVTAELKALKAKLAAVGENAMTGFVKGMKSKAKSLKGASKTLANSVVKTFQKYLKIHSPSKVFAQLGQYVGQGFVNGMESTARMIQRVAADVISIPQAEAPVMALAGGGRSGAYDYYSAAEYTIIVPVELDGREVARVTAPYTQKELDRIQIRDSRKRGKTGR